MASVAELAKQINKKWKSDVLTDGNFTKEIKTVPVGDLGFDYPLYGGLPEGSIVVFSGLSHSGKTTAACQAMAEYQKKYPDRVCIYVDAENTLLVQGDYIHRMTGLNLDSSQFLRYDMTGISAEEMFEDIINMESGDDIGMIVIDSAPALISQQDLDTNFTKDNGMRSTIAKSLLKFVKFMENMLPKRENILLIINQVRISGKTFTGAPIYSEPCGSALDYFPAMKVRFGTRTFTQGDKTDISGSKGEGADGFRLKFSITKNRIGATDRGGGFLTYRYGIGLDRIQDMLEVATSYGYIERPNNMTYILTNLDTGKPYTDEEGNDLKFVGKSKLIDYIKEHTEFQDEYFEMLTRHVSNSSAKVNLLDEKTMNEIFSQEAAVSSDAEMEEETDE